jgi:hypothetical protein
VEAAQPRPEAPCGAGVGGRRVRRVLEGVVGPHQGPRDADPLSTAPTTSRPGSRSSGPVRRPLTPTTPAHAGRDAQVAEEKTVHMGDVCVDLKTFFDIYPDPLASEEGLESAQFLIEEAVYSPDYVHDHLRQGPRAADTDPTRDRRVPDARFVVGPVPRRATRASSSASTGTSPPPASERQAGRVGEERGAVRGRQPVSVAALCDVRRHPGPRPLLAELPRRT